jgi:hypothetical protein
MLYQFWRSGILDMRMGLKRGRPLFLGCVLLGELWLFFECGLKDLGLCVLLPFQVGHPFGKDVLIVIF